MTKINMVSHNGCAICIMTRKTLEKKDVELHIFADHDDEGREIVEKSGLKSFPIIEVSGKFYCGNDAYKFAKTI